MQRKPNAKAGKGERPGRRWLHGDWCAEGIRLSMVLQDCANQMAVLGHITRCVTKSPVIVEEKTWEMKFADSANLSEEEQERRRMHMELRDALDNKPLTPDRLTQVDHDQRFLAEVIKDTLDELQEAGTFNSLLDAVEGEKRKKANYTDVIQQEEEGRMNIIFYQFRLQEIRKEWLQEGRDCEEFTAQLHAQLQEMKAKGTMEREYNHGISELKVQQAEEHNLHRESLLNEKVQILEKKITEEHHIHDEMDSFLMEQLVEQEEKLEVWMDMYDREMEVKQKNLQLGRNIRNKLLEQLQNMRVTVARAEMGQAAAREAANTRFDEGWEELSDE